MRFTALIILVASLQVCAKGFAQEKITLAEKDAAIQKVIADIQKQTSYDIWYDKSSLPKNVGITINLKNASLEEALDAICKNQNLEYNIAGKMVVIRARMISKQDFEIKGKVVTNKGEPLEAAAVIVRGTHIGTQTDDSGLFSLRVEKSTVELDVSYTGYATKTVHAQSGQFLNVQLLQSTNPLDQIQVIAYGTTSQRLNTGNVSTVTSETIAEQPVSNPLSAIEGRVPGLVITQNTGMPGGSFTVQIRGQNSIANGNDPLYIIDGVPFSSTPLGSLQSYTVTGEGNPLNSFNPSDIESISVLKDADATAIYGSRGANGVVLIVTKKGKAGKTSFNLNAYTGIGKLTRTMPLLNTQQYLEMRHEAFANDGATPDPGFDYDITSWDTTRYTDWVKTLIGGTANISDIQASVSGGSTNTQFLLGAGFHRETTVFPGDFGDNKGSVHFNLSHSSQDQKFKLNFSTSYVIDQNKLFSGDITMQAMQLPPDAPAPFDSAGKLNWAGGGYDNPYSYLMQTFKMNTTNLVSNLVMSYQLTKGLQLKLSGGYTTTQLRETELFPLSTMNPAWGLTNSSACFADNYVKSWVVEPQIEYRTSLGPGKLNVLIGTTMMDKVSSNQLLEGVGYTNEKLLNTLAGAGSIYNLSTTYADYRYAAIFGRINYNITDRYLIDLTARRDGSSRFGPGKQFANFGAAGIGWIFSKTAFVKNHLQFLSFGKIRSSYGITGNDQIGEYQYLDLWSPTPYPYQQVQGLTPTSLLNTDYGWETNRKLEIGTELGFLNDRVFTKVSWYKNQSSNQLVGYPLPNITGFGSIQANLPAEVENKGWELEIQTVNIQKTNFSWTTAFTISFPTNRLVAYPNLAASAYAKTFVVGHPISAVQTFKVLGVNDSSGLYQFLSAKGQPTYSPNFFTDRMDIVNINPIYYGGLENKIFYKGLQLDFFFQWTKQTGKNYLHGYVFQPPGFFGNQPTVVLNRWQKSADQAPVERYTQTYGDAYLGYANATFYGNSGFSDASFIRLKNVSLSYQFSQNMLHKMKLNNLRIYIQGQNLLTITHYQGMDPENQSFVNLPPLKVFTAGLQITL